MHALTCTHALTHACMQAGTHIMGRHTVIYLWCNYASIVKSITMDMRSLASTKTEMTVTARTHTHTHTHTHTTHTPHTHTHTHILAHICTYMHTHAHIKTPQLHTQLYQLV